MVGFHAIPRCKLVLGTCKDVCLTILSNLKSQAANIVRAHSQSLEKAEELHQALQEEYDDQCMARKKSIRQFQKMLQKMNEKNEKLRQELSTFRGEKTAGRVQALWFVRVCFADPSASLESLSMFCQHFPEEERVVISPSTIAAAKNAMAEVLKKLACAAISDAAGSHPCLPGTTMSTAVFVKQVHDEALMKLRSFNPGLGSHSIRGKYSKIQNNCVEVRFGEKILPFCQ